MDIRKMQKLLRAVKKAKKLLIGKVSDKECLKYLLKNGYLSKKIESEEKIVGDAPSWARKFKFLHKRYNLTVEENDSSFVKITRKGELKLRHKEKEEEEEVEEVVTKEEEEEEDGKTRV